MDSVPIRGSTFRVVDFRSNHCHGHRTTRSRSLYRMRVCACRAPKTLVVFGELHYRSVAYSGQALGRRSSRRHQRGKKQGGELLCRRLQFLVHADRNRAT